jgi:multiple sugar transport system substrate-binding protein
MKKTIFLAISLFAVLGAVLVFASPKAEAPLQVQVYQDNPGQHIPTQAIIKEWAAKNNEKVEMIVVTKATKLTGVTTALESGTGPDILVLEWVEPYQYAEGLLDITDIGNELGRENGGWYPIAETFGKVNGRWVNFPIYLLGQMVLYRKDMLADAGVTIPEDVTWEQFRQGLQILKANLPPDVLPFGISLNSPGDGQQFILARTMAEGGKVVSDDGSRIVWNSPETVRALKYIIGLVEDGLMNPDPLSWDDSTNNQAFLSGKIAITFNSNSIKLQASREFPDLDPFVGTAVMPEGVSFASPSGFSIRKSTKHPEKAKSLLKYMCSFDNYARILEETYGAIGCAFKGHAKLDVWSGDNETNLLAIPGMQLPCPPSAEFSEAYNGLLFSDMVADVLDKNMTPEAAVERTAERLEQIYFGN